MLLDTCGILVFFRKVVYFYFCEQVKSENGNGVLVLSGGDQMCLWARLFVAAREKRSLKATWIDTKGYYFTMELQR